MSSALRGRGAVGVNAGRSGECGADVCEDRERSGGLLMRDWWVSRVVVM